jgi:hypothetical protein
MDVKIIHEEIQKNVGIQALSAIFTAFWYIAGRDWRLPVAVGF